MLVWKNTLTVKKYLNFPAIFGNLFTKISNNKLIEFYNLKSYFLQNYDKNSFAH